MKKIRVLSIDGGGIRGVIPASVLVYIEKRLAEITNRPNARIAEYFDLIAGTSTGAILGCLCLVPNASQKDGEPIAKYTAQEALDFYVKRGYEIFNKSKRKKWLGLRQLVNATKYSPKVLEEIFESNFGNLKMSELLKPCLVTTYNLQSKSAFFLAAENQNINSENFM